MQECPKIHLLQLCHNWKINHEHKPQLIQVVLRRVHQNLHRNSHRHQVMRRLLAPKQQRKVTLEKKKVEVKTLENEEEKIVEVVTVEKMVTAVTVVVMAENTDVEVIGIKIGKEEVTAVKNHQAKKKSDPVKPKNLDTIDKLDVTGFVGFHHDGPFDACAPHRNVKKEKAPVMAFPIDGPNNSIAGGTNMTKDDQLNLAFGNYHEETPVIKTNRTQNDPTSSIYTPKQNPSVINFDSNTNSTPIHGSTTAGLGSTTFLDGAPAPKGDELLNPNAGVGRKKSIVQRLRKNSGSESNSRRSSNEGLQPPSPPYQEPRRGSLNTLELDNDDNELKPPGNSFIRRVRSLKVRK